MYRLGIHLNEEAEMLIHFLQMVLAVMAGRAAWDIGAWLIRRNRKG